MLTTKNLVLTGAVCAALAFGARAQSQTEWTDQGPDASWNDDANWDNNEPDSTIDAAHTTTLTDIEVNTTSATCKSFEGKSGSADRFAVILQDKVLTVVNNLFKTTGAGTPLANFVLKMKDGSGVSEARTTLDVSGDVTSVDVVPTGGSGDWVKIIVDGDVIDSPFIVGDNGLVTFGDASTDVVRGGAMLFGTKSAAAGDVTTVTVSGSAGTATDPVDENWTLRGHAGVTVEGNFIMTDQTSPPITLPLVEQRESASLTVKGDVAGGDWHVFDDSRFTGTDDATVITGGECEIEDRGRARPDCSHCSGIAGFSA